MADPQLTVLLPVYNAGGYLRRAVLSILKQTFIDWELLVIDDASTDGAVEGIADIADPRILIKRNSRNLGLAATLNVGIDLARGRYLARMDQDDIAYPERFTHQFEVLDRNPEIDLVGVRCIAIDENDEPVGVLPFALTHRELCANPWRGFYLPHPTWLGRIEWFRKHRYASPAPYLCEDQELLLRTYTESCFAMLPEVLFAYRIRSSPAWRKSYKTRTSVLKMQIKHFSGKGQWRYCALSAFIFLVRVATDSINSLLQTMHWKGLRRYTSPIAAAEQARWRYVIASLRVGG
jgi:glycosyltransferase involved in cell wall biosynthesis